MPVSRGLLLGFDPGKPGKFGWCIAAHTDSLPLRILSSGLANFADDAVRSALAAGAENDSVIAVGIDAPLYWKTTGRRLADVSVRKDIASLGAPHPHGTVQDINSLRGACLVQGVMTAMLLRRRHPHIVVTEAHPKALLWLLGHARRGVAAASVTLEAIRELTIPDEIGPEEDIRDAALCVLSAWAAVAQPREWRDRAGEDSDCLGPLGPNVNYWLPGPPGYAP